MTACKPAVDRLEIVHLPVGELRANPWNPNRVAPETLHKLREYVAREGFVQPVVVRRVADHYQIVDGYHRWLLAKDEIGLAEVPCVVVDVDDKRAKMMTVNLNELSGDPVPHLMAELIHDLSRDISIDDLSTILPYGEDELRDFEALLQLPDGLDSYVEEQAEQAAKEAPKVLSFVVDDPAPIEAAIEHAMERIEGKNRRGRALAMLAESYANVSGLTIEAGTDGEAPDS